jgi:uncharacterized RDD family membrane protein YckC
MADGEWHYALGNEQFGPVTPEALQDLINKGSLTRQDRVWRPGMNQWMPAGDLASLEPLFRAAGAPQVPGNPSSPMPLPMAMGGLLPYATPNFYGGPQYAGFWRRFAAAFIDGLALDLVLIPVGIIFGNFRFAPQPNPLQAFTGLHLFGTLVNYVVPWLYYSLMESSSFQATLGKMAIGIEVTDLNGQRITFGRATGRYWGKMISALTLGIGFIMAGVTEKKQALHDFMANTLVICKP